MADMHFTSAEKLDAYERLARLNRSLTNTAKNLHALEHGRIFNPKSLRTFRGLAKELQALINCSMVQTLRAVEAQDAFRFGKVRIKWEHRLNPERPAFNPGPLPAPEPDTEPDTEPEV